MAGDPTLQELQERLAASEALVAELQSESEQRYKAFFEATNVALVVLEFELDGAGRPVDFRHIRINPAFEGISGFKAEDILGRLVTEMAPPDEALEWIRFYGRVLTSGVPDHVERFSPTMGRWIKVSAAPFGPNQVAAVFENVTERKRAEVMMRESEARHRLLVGSWAQAAWETDASGVVIADSPSWRAYTGQTREEWLGYGWLDAIHPDDRAYAERQWREATAARGLVNAEFRLRAPDGGWRWTNVRAAPLLDEGGDIEKWVGMNIDIEARMRAEAALGVSEARYRQMLETMNAAFAAFEAVRGPDGTPVDFRISETDAALERLTGLSSTKVEGRLLTEILPESDARAWIDAFASVLASDEAAYAEHEIAALGRWFSADIIPYGPDRVAHVYVNITDRKRAEAVLRESEERQAFLLRLSDTLRPLRDALQIQQAATELLGRQLAVNSAGYYEVGADQDTFFLTGRWERGTPPLPERMLITDFGHEIREGYRAGRTMIARDTEQDAASEPNLAAARALAIRAWIGVPLVKEGRWFAAVGVHSLMPRDWTPAEIRLVEEVGERTWAAVERARAEAALRESEELRRMALESGGMGAWTWDTRNATIRSDAVVQALWGVSTSEQPHTVLLYADRMHPEGMAWLEAVAAKEKAPGEEFHTQLQVATGLSSTRWVQLRGRAERDTPWIINGVTFDITEQRLAEQRLAESEAKYAGLFEASPAPFLILKPDAPHFTIMEVNEAYLAATMRTRDAVVGRGIFEAYPDNPDEAPGGGMNTLRASLERVLASKRPDALSDFKYDLARPDGSFEERWWSPVNSPVLDANGEVETIIHNANDVTADHRAEAELRYRGEQFRTLIQQAPLGVYLVDADFRIAQVNAVAEPVFGDIPDLIGRDFGELIHILWEKPYADEVVDLFRHTLETGEPYVTPERAQLRADRGLVEYYAWRIDRITLPDGRYGVVCYFSDISEQVWARLAIAESEQKYAALLWASPVPVMVLDPNAPDFTVRSANEAYFAATLTTPETLVGRRLFDVFTDDRSRPGQMGSEALNISLERVLATKRTDAMPRVRYDLAVPGGFEPHWWEAINAPTLDASGQVSAIIHQVTRVTELHLAGEEKRENQEREGFLLKLSDALRTLADAAQIQVTTTRLLGTHLGVDRAMYAEVEGKQGAETGTICAQYLRPAGEGSPAPLPFPERFDFRPFGAHTMAARYRGETLVVADVDASPAFGQSERAAWIAAGVRAAVVVPLAKQGRLVAEFGVHCAAPRAWSDAEVSLIQGVAERTWAAAERAYAQAALRESEALFRTLAETAPALIWRNDTEGGNQFINQHFLNYTGKLVDELAGEGWRTVVHPDDADAYIAGYQAAVREQRGWSNRNRIRRHDGAWRWFENYAQPLFDGQNRFLGHVGVSTDVDVSVRAEQAIRESEARWRALFEGMTEGFFTAEVIRDGAGKITDYRHLQINPAFEKLTGVSPEQAVGRTALEVVPGLPQDLIDRYGRVVDTGEPADFEVHVPALNDRWYEARVNRIGPAEFAVLFVEITERKRNEQALRTADERKNEFLATLAHELRNPLAPLRTGLSILERIGESSADAVRTRERMERQVTQLVRLVDDLLDVSRVSQGKIELRKSVHSLQSLVDLALETSRPLLDAAGHHLRVELPAEPVLLTVDATRIAQVLTNILNNAAKYSSDGGQVRLLAERAAPDRVRLQVEDSGMGIPSDMVERVFDLFTQVTHDGARSQGGLGIGLSLSRRLVELHGGTVRASSPGLGEGSTFTVELPAMPPRPSHDIPKRAREAASASEVSRKSVLVVDDNVDAAQMLAVMLQLAGHKVRVVHTGTDALAAFGPDEAPDVVFLDIGLPDRSGYEVARGLRLRRDFDRTVLVALTGWGADRDRERAREAGFDEHLTKPASLDAVAAALASTRPPTHGPVNPGRIDGGAKDRTRMV